MNKQDIINNGRRLGKTILTKKIIEERQYHIKKHIELHKSLDELLADFINHNPKTLLSQISVFALMSWSAEQTKNPQEYD